LLLFAGLIYGPFFPNLMAVLLNHFPVELHGRAVGVLFGCASIGWTARPKNVAVHRREAQYASSMILLGIGNNRSGSARP